MPLRGTRFYKGGWRELGCDLALQPPCPVALLPCRLLAFLPFFASVNLFIGRTPLLFETMYKLPVVAFVGAEFICLLVLGQVVLLWLRSPTTSRRSLRFQLIFCFLPLQAIFGVSLYYWLKNISPISAKLLYVLLELSWCTGLTIKVCTCTLLK